MEPSRKGLSRKKMSTKRLNYVCKILGFCGCWKPDSWTSWPMRMLYYTYAVCVWFIMHLLSLSQMLDLVMNVRTAAEFSENFYVTLAILFSGCKMSNLLLLRRQIVNMVHSIDEEPFSAVNSEEEEIRVRYDKLATRNAVVYTFVINSYVALTVVVSMFTRYRNHQLLYRAWLPYDYTNWYSVTFFHQLLALSYAAFVTVSIDSLFNGFLIHTSCHFEIFEHRLKTIMEDKNRTLKRCSYLHDHIYKYAAVLNDSFSVVMIIQTLSTIATVCCNMFLLTQNDVGSRFMEVFVYTFDTLAQIFYYCWYGNEIKLKSLDVSKALYHCNWIPLDNDAKKILMMMVRRSRVPVEFSVIHIVSMDLDMFTTILKTSYSAYNLLQ